MVSRRRFSFGTFCPEVSAGDEIPQGKLGRVQLVHQPLSGGGNAKGRNEERKDEEHDPAHRLPADEQDQGEQRQHNLERPPHLVQRPLALMERADDGQQHIGIVFNGVEVKMVFVIIVGAGILERSFGTFT